MSENEEISVINRQLSKASTLMSQEMAGNLLDYDLNTMYLSILGIFSVSELQK